MDKIKELSIDLETYSDVDLKKCGVYRYSESTNFEILLFGYSVNNGPVTVVDVACGETIPEEILKALTDDSVIKWAYNSQFERVCLSYWLRKRHPDYFSSYSIAEDTVGNYLDPSAWRCSRIWGAYMGLPLSLEGIGAVLKLTDQKMKEGKDLIKYFCCPCKPTKSNGGRTRNLPEHDPEKWTVFKSYNKRDVEVELQIKEKLAKFAVPEFIWEQYALDQEINDRGIGVDMQLVENAIRIDAQTKEALLSQMQTSTGLDNPNSVSQMRGWLSDNGIETESLDKKAVKSLLPDADDHIAAVLECRQQLAKSSVSKYKAMENMVCADGRARGCFMFYGASRSGRWAGRGIQLQNLPQNHLLDLDEARNLVRDGNFDALELLYDNIPQVLSELIRTAFVPKPGYKYIVADFSAIEARVLSFLANEQWRMDLFAKGGDIYCESASEMFKVPVVKNGMNGHLRQKGKIAELACIAEGSLVLTNHGEKPIETVMPSDLLWDGENWVEHDGVVFRGEREVITYEGLTATPDHLVWVEGKSEPIQFGIAAASGTHLVQTGNGRNPVRLGNHHFPRKAMGHIKEELFCSCAMPKLWRYKVASARRFAVRTFQRVRKMFQTKANTKMARTSYNESKAALRKSKPQSLQRLWRTRYKIRFSRCHCRRNLDNRKPRSTRQRFRNRQNRQQWKLFAREYPFCNKIRKLREQKEHRIISLRAKILALLAKICFRKISFRIYKGTDNSGCRKSCSAASGRLASNKCTARLYDIRNAGRYHRFTVSNHLVHNCGYGGAKGALISMGALEMGLQEEELQPLVDAWRAANPNITRFWWAIDAAVKEAVIYKTATDTHGFHIYYQSGMLFIDLPSGRRLSYVKPRMGVNQFGSDSVTYEGTTTGKWGRIESYGPKFVENIVQAVSRDILAYSMQTLSHCCICGHVHDELIIECSRDVSLDAICEQMGRTPPWIKGLLLRADGYECNYYQKQ